MSTRNTCISSAVRLLLIVIALVGQTVAQEIRFPASAVLDAKRDFGAQGNGVADDTAALQQAFEQSCGQSRVIYLPNGTYRVTRPLILQVPGGNSGTGSGVGPWIYGQDRDATIIRLQDGANGYGDANNPKEVIRGHGRADGATMNADFFDRTLVNFTVDCGNNRGAIGLKYYSNNTGVMRAIKVLGNGACGINLGWTDQNGPLLIQDVEIDGFATGISTSNILNSQTFSRVTVRHASTVGLWLQGQMVAIEGLVVTDSPLAMEVRGGALVSMVDCNLSTTNGSGPAIQTRNPPDTKLYVQRLTTSGYQRAIVAEGGSGADGPYVVEFSSQAPIQLGGGSLASGLALPIQRAPDIPWDTDLNNWVCANDFGCATGWGNDADDAPGLQAAIDYAAANGKTTVYILGGQGGDPNWYFMQSDVRVHGSVRHITGLGFVRLIGGGGSDAGYPNDAKTFYIEDEPGAPSAVFLSHLQVFAPQAGFAMTNRSTTRSMVCDTTGGIVMAKADSTVFMTNCVGALFQDASSRVFIRQWNTEGVQTNGPRANTVNDGGQLWVLGMKTEHYGTKLRTLNGGRSEILGVHNYNTTGVGDDTPFFEVLDGAMSCSGYREINFGNSWWRVPVRAVLSGQESRHPSSAYCQWALLCTGSPSGTPLPPLSPDVVRGQFGRSGSAITDGRADLDGNNRVDAVDLGLVLRQQVP